MSKKTRARTGELSNGIKVLTERIPNIRSLTVGVWLRSGSRFEDPARGGICHFLEHMVFKRTMRRTTWEIARLIDIVGGQCNGFTDKEFTCFYAKALDEHTDLILDLLSDIMVHPAFLDSDVEGEKKVVLEEIKMVEDMPEHVLHQRLMEGVWKGHPLSRPTVGTRESVLALTNREMEVFFREQVVAGKLLITAAGNLEHDSFMEKLDRYFGQIPSGGALPEASAPAYTPCRISETKQELNQIHLSLLLPTFKRDHPGRYSLAVLLTLLGTGMSSRLFQKVREERGLVYDIDVEGVTFADCGYMVVYAGTSQEAVQEVVSITMEELRDLKRMPPGPDEVYRAKEHLKGSLMLGLENTFQRMAHLASQEIYYGRQSGLDEILSAIEKVSQEDVHRLSEEIFSANAVSAGILGKVNGIEITEEALEC